MHRYFIVHIGTLLIVSYLYTSIQISICHCIKMCKVHTVRHSLLLPPLSNMPMVTIVYRKLVKWLCKVAAATIQHAANTGFFFAAMWLSFSC